MHFMSTLKKVTGLPNNNMVINLLITLNKIHSLDMIHNAYKSIYTKLSECKLVDEQPIFAERVEEAFD